MAKTNNRREFLSRLVISGSTEWYGFCSASGMGRGASGMHSHAERGNELLIAITPDPGHKPLPLLDGNPVLLSKDNRLRFININKDYALSVTFVRE